MLKKIAALLLVPVLLAGCSAAGDVETLLRTPQLSATGMTALRKTSRFFQSPSSPRSAYAANSSRIWSFS